MSKAVDNRHSVGEIIFSSDKNNEHFSISVLRENESLEQISTSDGYGDSSNKPVPKAIIKQSPSASKEKHCYFDVFKCECGLDFYNRVLGPTADEAILRGIQTIINVYHLVYHRLTMPCHVENLKTEKTASIVLALDSIKSVDVFESVQNMSSVKSAPTVVSEILESLGFPPEMASEIIQTSLSILEKEHPELASKILQTSTPEMVSQILQTIGLSPEMASQVVQTSFAELVEERRKEPSERIVPQLQSGMMQTSPAPSAYSAFAQTSEPVVDISAPRESSLSVIKESDPKIAISKKSELDVVNASNEPSNPKTVEIPQKLLEEKRTECQCCCQSTEKCEIFLPCLSVSNSIVEANMPTRCCNCSRMTSQRSKIHHDCICYLKSRLKCKCSLGFKRARSKRTIMVNEDASNKHCYSLIDSNCCGNHHYKKMYRF